MAREIELIITVQNEQAIQDLRRVDQAIAAHDTTARKASASMDAHGKATAATGAAAGATATTTRQLTTATTATAAATATATKATDGLTAGQRRAKEMSAQAAQHVRAQTQATNALAPATAVAASRMGVFQVSLGAAAAATAGLVLATGGLMAVFKAAGKEWLEVSGTQDRVTRASQGLQRAWKDLLYTVGAQLAGSNDFTRPFATLEQIVLRLTPAVAGLAGALRRVGDLALELSGLSSMARGLEWLFPDPNKGLPSGPKATTDRYLKPEGPASGLLITNEELEAESRRIWAQVWAKEAKAVEAAAKERQKATAVAVAVLTGQPWNIGAAYPMSAGAGGAETSGLLLPGYDLGGVSPAVFNQLWKQPNVTMADTLVGPAPPKPGLFSGVGAVLPQLGSTILGAWQGGGSVSKSVGGLLGGGLLSGEGGLGKAMTGAVSKLSGTLGSMLGSVLPGIGTMLGGLAGGLVDKVFGPSQASQVKKMRDEFLGGVGDLQALEKQAELAGFSMARLYNAKKVKEFEQAQKDLAAALKHWEDQLRTAQDAARGLTDLTAGWAASLKGVTEATDESQASFDRLGGFAFTVFANLLQHTGDFNLALEAVGPALDILIEKQGEFGFVASGAVQNLLDIRKFNQEHPEIAQRISGLTTLMTALNKNGWMSVEMVQDFGHEAVSAFHQATKAGATQEQALMQLQPALQIIWEKQRDNNLILDEGTQELLDMAKAGGLVGESFEDGSKAMLRALQGIEKAIDKLVDGLLGIGRVNIPEVNIPVRYTPVNSPTDSVDTAALGGYVTADGVQYFARGGTVLPFRPRGTDTVPAMLTPGEGVVTRQGMAVLGRDRLAALNRGRGVGGGVSVSVHVDARESFYDSAASRDRLADKVGATILRKLQTRERLSARGA